MMSQNMSLFVKNLQGNWGFIENFLNNPEMFMNQFELNKDEKDALLARDIDSLSRLGIDKSVALGALSGAHSQSCTPIIAAK
jgi:hypothetical protein